MAWFLRKSVSEQNCQAWSASGGGGGAGDSLRLGEKQKLRAFVFKMAFETSKIEKEKRKKSGYVL